MLPCFHYFSFCFNLRLFFLACVLSLASTTPTDTLSLQLLHGNEFAHTSLVPFFLHRTNSIASCNPLLCWGHVSLADLVFVFAYRCTFLFALRFEHPDSSSSRSQMSRVPETFCLNAYSSSLFVALGLSFGVPACNLAPVC